MRGWFTLQNQKGIVMKQRFILFRRADMFYCEDTDTGKQTSLRTKDKDEAQRLLNAKNEAEKQPAINLQIARAYLAASDPQVATRNWQFVMDEAAKLKEGSTGDRWARAMRDRHKWCLWQSNQRSVFPNL